MKNVPEDYWSGGPVREGEEGGKKPEVIVEGGGGEGNVLTEEKPTGTTHFNKEYYGNFQGTVHLQLCRKNFDTFELV